MRKVELLISESRADTDNETFTSDTGIDDEECLKHINDGQSRIYALIQNRTPDVFLSEDIQTVVPGTESYTLPLHTYLGTRIDKLEYSSTGQDINYYQLKQGKLNERVTGLRGRPQFYIRRGSTLLIQPSPISGGTIRITYQKAIPKLDKRRAVVSAVTLDTSARTITSLTLDPTLLTSDDIDIMKEEAYICFVDKDGAQQMTKIPITDIDATTGAVSVYAGFVYDSGETIAVGNYAVKGSYSSTHSSLPEPCEKYLTKYLSWSLQKQDSSNDSTEAFQELQMHESEIVESFSEPDSDVDYPPILDVEFISFYE